MRIILFSVFVVSLTFLSLSMKAGDHVTMTMLNPTSTSTTLEFDVYLVNDGTTSLKLGGYQFGVNFSPTILSTGTPTTGSYTYIAGTRDIALASLTTPSVQYNNNQLKVVSTTIPVANSVQLPIGTQFCLGRFRFTNTTAWLTVCIATCFLGTAVASTALSYTLTTLNAVIGFTGFTLNAAPLPVELSAFNGRQKGAKDEITWTTLSEQNNSFFNLQHSVDALQFETISKVNSHADRGNSTEPFTYQSTNKAPAVGHNYYRLQEVDLNGQVQTESRVIDLYHTSTNQGITVYPNPTKDQLIIVFETNEAIPVTITLYTMNGQTIRTNSFTSLKGMNEQLINLNGVQAGQYALRIQEEDQIIYSGSVSKNE